HARREIGAGAAPAAEARIGLLAVLPVRRAGVAPEALACQTSTMASRTSAPVPSKMRPSTRIRSMLGRQVTHLTSVYVNNRLEQDHRGIKGRIRCVRGLKSFTSADQFC
ncbi:DDE-type integrase/transposase/recombinase, partial [Roseomonas sp. GCM10028921]